MNCNVGGADRTVRLLLGIVLLAISFFALSGALAVVGYIVSAVALVTGLVRYCPANQILGIDTCGGSDEASVQ